MTILFIYLIFIEKQNSSGCYKLDLDIHNNSVQISKPSSQKMKQNSGTYSLK